MNIQNHNSPQQFGHRTEIEVWSDILRHTL